MQFAHVKTDLIKNSYFMQLFFCILLEFALESKTLRINKKMQEKYISITICIVL